MGALPAFVYHASREAPKYANVIDDTLTGIGSKTEETTKKTKNYLGYVNTFIHTKLGR